MRYLIFILLSNVAIADVGFVKISDIGKTQGIVIYYDGKCPAPCVPHNGGVDPLYQMVLVNGSLVIDPVKQKAASDAAAAAAVDEANKKSTITAIQAIDVSKLDLQGTQDVLKKLIQVSLPQPTPTPALSAAVVKAISK